MALPGEARGKLVVDKSVVGGRLIMARFQKRDDERSCVATRSDDDGANELGSRLVYFQRHHLCFHARVGATTSPDPLKRDNRKPENQAAIVELVVW